MSEADSPVPVPVPAEQPAAPSHRRSPRHHHKRENAALRVLRASPRLFICFAVAVVAGIAMPNDWHLATRFLLCWNIGSLVFFVLVTTMMAGATREAMRRRAKEQDESRFAILTASVAAAIVSLVAIVAELGAVKDMTGLFKAAHIGLAGVTIVTAWAFIHMMFALHYAFEFFREKESDPNKEAELRGGLHFPGTAAPTYSDFVYFSFIIGVASQTADVEITSKAMRKLSLAHSILSFFFNTTLLALTINIAAGLI